MAAAAAWRAAQRARLLPSCLVASARRAGPRRFRFRFSSSAECAARPRRRLARPKHITQAERRFVPQATAQQAFHGGELLCDAVDALEARRDPSQTPGARKTKNGRVNLNRALEVLRARVNMNIRHLWDAQPLLEGDVRTTWEMLEDLMASYGPHEPPRPARKRPPSKAAKDKDRGKGKGGGSGKAARMGFERAPPEAEERPPLACGGALGSRGGQGAHRSPPTDAQALAIEKRSNLLNPARNLEAYVEDEQARCSCCAPRPRPAPRARSGLAWCARAACRLLPPAARVTCGTRAAAGGA